MSQFGDYVREVFELFGPVSLRRMFGGKGVFHEGLMFALIADDTLYLKADSHILDYFEDKGLSAFEYKRRGKWVKLSYHQAPEEIMDDREEAAVWARRSFGAALRSKHKKK